MEEIIIAILDDIRKIYGTIAPDLLNKRKTEKTSEADITAFEKALGEKLPDDYRFFLLNNTFLIDFCFNFSCLTLKQSARSRDSMNEFFNNGTFDKSFKIREKEGNWKNNKLKKVWWSLKWIPFAEDSAGNMFCIDLDPGKVGKKYQIINMELQDGQGPYCSGTYNSFTDFLEKHLGYLQNGQYTAEDGEVMIDPYINPKNL
jgi:cell wall assembly regulator SMI1